MQTFGKRGEAMAEIELRQKGYKILQRNFRYGKSEIDLIVQGEGLLIFVEVKTRSSNSFGFPEDFVGKNQQEAIIRAANYYVEESGWKGDIRFDIVAVVVKQTTIQIEHLKDAFY
ncbi:YraN family protein [Roseivirga sp.]|uniref:YraN family protein n=1 Tax=Roseivirga sp. TaxID=1964215 RepID=UPI003B525A64